ncbi:MAG: hypothetical protein BMS9Abin02_0864 [Anaerolineae bacterium]|nr:MAG: hypothetical protein BMS9Abin02_0864 [Anaerolineae bacterium]
MRVVYATAILAGRLKFFLVMMLVVITALIGMTSIMAEETTPADAILDGSTKSVNKKEALAGETIQYTVVISNNGDTPATNVWMTDTLAVGTTYVKNSIKAKPNQGTVTDTNDVMSWYGALNNNQQIEIIYEVTIAEDVEVGTKIMNTAEITGAGKLIYRSVTTTVITESFGTQYLPVIFQPLAAVTLNSIGRPTPDNKWTLNWTIPDTTGVTDYEIEEANNPDFTNSQSTMVGSTNTSYQVQQPFSTDNQYYYRVRATGPSGHGRWSNTQAVVGGYRDDFNDSGSGWAMRRQDTDHVENQVYYQNGHLVLEMDSSWDYLIAGPMALPPEPPYRIETRVRLEGVDNLHGYGIIFGADQLGQPCPNADYSSCFNQYYRLTAFWSGNADKRMTTQLKRIDYHDDRNNAGRGVKLTPWLTPGVNDPANGYQQWAIEVYPSGLIKIFVNGKFVDDAFDTNYIDRPFFGTFASTDEYNGLQAEYDWYQVTPLP